VAWPNAEACRIVGINRRTGTRWRFGRRSRQRRATVALCTGDQHPDGGDLAEIPVRRTNGSRSPTCAGPARSAGHAARTGRSPATISRSCGATKTRKRVGIDRSRRTGWRCSDAAGGGPARSPGTGACGASCRTGWARSGARNRSATRCPPSPAPPGAARGARDHLPGGLTDPTSAGLSRDLPEKALRTGRRRRKPPPPP